MLNRGWICSADIVPWVRRNVSWIEAFWLSDLIARVVNIWSPTRIKSASRYRLVISHLGFHDFSHQPSEIAQQEWLAQQRNVLAGDSGFAGFIGLATWMKSPSEKEQADH